jgi:hypothetical protein
MLHEQVSIEQEAAEPADVSTAPAAEQEGASSVLFVGDDADLILRPELNERLQSNLKRFWGLHGTDFALHWLMKPVDMQVQFLKQASPDLPEKPAAPGAQCKATDLLVPEMCASVLMASQGRALVAVCQTRALENTDTADIELLRKLDAKKQMPIFSGIETGDLSQGFDAFASRLAFVHNGKIVTCDPSSEPAKKVEATKRIIASGNVVDANQWITKNYRQTILLTFCCGLADIYLAETGKSFGVREPATDAHIFGSILDIKNKLHKETCEGIDRLTVDPVAAETLAKDLQKEARSSKAGEAARKGADAARKAGQSSRRKR